MKKSILLVVCCILYISATINAQYSTGNLTGNFTASHTGDASYSIPIVIPPGLNGMQPELSINYGSGTGYGLAGFKWHLTGISIISRAPNNTYDDSSFDPIDLDASDKFSLDGKRLVCKSGTYGTTNAIYGLHIDNNEKITTYGTTGAGPSSFLLQNNKGITITYGKDANSRYLTSGSNTVYAWYISEAEDRNGNKIKYTYTKNNDGIPFLTSIDYTVNSTTSSMYRIDLEYSNTLLQHRYINGSKADTDQLLKYIKVYYGSTKLKEYELQHSTDGLYSLKQVFERNKDNETRKPLVFTYDNIIESSISMLPTEQTKSFRYGNFYNDKLTNLAYIQPRVQDEYYVYIKEFSSGSWTTKKRFTVEASNYTALDIVACQDMTGDGLDELILKEKVYVPEGSNIAYKVRVFTAEGQELYGVEMKGDEYTGKYTIGNFDEDRKRDILVFYKDASNNIKLKYRSSVSNSMVDIPWSGDNEFNKIKHIYTADLNGDGKSEFCYAKESNQHICEIVNNALVRKPIINTGQYPSIYDYDGNGVDDFITDGYIYYFSNFYEYTKEQLYSPDAENSAQLISDFLSANPDIIAKEEFSQTMKNYTQLCNLDGNHLPDLLNWRAPDIILANSSGGDLTSLQRTRITNYFSSHSVYCDRYNPMYGDKYYHIVFERTYRYYQQQANNTFSSTNRENFSYSFHGLLSQIQITDLDANGISEISYQYPVDPDGYGNDRKITELSFTNGLFIDDYLTKVTDSYGETIDIQYTPLTDAHCEDNTTSYPKMSYMPRKYYLERSIHSNGTAADMTIDYMFKKGLFHLERMEWLGFMYTETYNHRTDRKASTLNLLTSGADVLMPRYQYLYQGSTLWKKSTTTASAVSTGNKCYYHRPITIINEDYLNNRTLTSNFLTWDTYNNVTQKEDIIAGGRKTTYTYSYATGGWHCGYLQSLDKKEYSFNGDNKTEAIAFSYDTSGNLRMSMINMADNERRVRIQYTDFTSYGKPLTKTVYPADANNEITNYTYSNDGRFVTSETNTTTGSSNSMTYYEDMGLLKTHTISGEGTTTYNYDGWGRLKETILPTGKKSTKMYDWASGSAPTGAISKIIDNPAGGASSISWLDAKGRVLRIDEDAYNAQTSAVYMNYDSQGRLENKSNKIKLGDPFIGTYFTYDAYDRLKTKSLPEGYTITYSYSTTSVTETSPQSKISTEFDSNGWTAKVSDTYANKSITYVYYANGLLKSATPSSTNQSVQMQYDVNGNRTKITDPDAGTVTSEYNSINQLTKQTLADGTVYNYTYNSKNQLYTKSISGMPTNTYYYDTIGRLTRVANSETETVFEFDTYGRVFKEKEKINSRWFIKEYNYTDYYQLKTTKYPNNYILENVYDANGMLSSIKDGIGTTLWRAELNVAGLLEKDFKGNTTSLIGHYVYDDLYRPTHEITDDFEFRYTYDSNGNLYEKTKYKGAATNNLYQKETYTYDALNQLKSWTVSGTLNGEIKRYEVDYNTTHGFKSNEYLSTDPEQQFEYDTNHPNAIKSITYVEGDKFEPYTITYNGINQPSSIWLYKQTQSNPGGPVLVEDIQVNYKYGIDGMRNYRETMYNNSPSQCYYFDDYEESDSEETIYLNAYGRTKAILRFSGSTTPTVMYTFSNYQNSLMSIKNGSATTQQDYDPWGRTRDPEDWTIMQDNNMNTSRGFTGHEHVGMGLINMNGRLYDQVTNGFLSPDPYVQAPNLVLNYDRYAYALNNPLMNSDPTGYNFLEDIWDGFWNMMHSFAGFMDNLGISGGVGVNVNMASGAVTSPYAPIVDPSFQVYNAIGRLQGTFNNFNNFIVDYSTGISSGIINSDDASINGGGVRPITLTVGSIPIGNARTWAYPDKNNKTIYTIPTYQLTATGTNSSGQKVSRSFEIIRFGVYTHSSGRVSVVGLADKQSYTIQKWRPEYSVRSASSVEMGAWVVTGSYLIHDGPDNPLKQIYATAGCIEICGGPRGFDTFNRFLLELSGASSLKDLGSSGMMKINYQKAVRPPLVIYKP